MPNLMYIIYDIYILFNQIKFEALYSANVLSLVTTLIEIPCNNGKHFLYEKIACQTFRQIVQTQFYEFFLQLLTFSSSSQTNGNAILNSSRCDDVFVQSDFYFYFSLFNVKHNFKFICENVSVFLLMLKNRYSERNKCVV